MQPSLQDGIGNYLHEACAICRQDDDNSQLEKLTPVNLPLPLFQSSHHALLVRTTMTEHNGG